MFVCMLVLLLCMRAGDDAIRYFENVISALFEPTFAHAGSMTAFWYLVRV